MLYPSIAKSFLAFWAAALAFGLDLAEGGGNVGFIIGDFEGITSPRNFLLFTWKVTKNNYSPVHLVQDLESMHLILLL